MTLPRVFAGAVAGAGEGEGGDCGSAVFTAEHASPGVRDTDQIPTS